MHAYTHVCTLCVGGGGVAAGVLTAAGLTVAVVEKGGLYGTADYAAMSEMQGFQSLYEKQGLCTSDDGNVIVSDDTYYYYIHLYLKVLLIEL
jgi:choline dehydrogenase-like flavoprotein